MKEPSATLSAGAMLLSLHVLRVRKPINGVCGFALYEFVVMRALIYVSSVRCNSIVSSMAFRIAVLRYRTLGQVLLWLLHFSNRGGDAIRACLLIQHLSVAIRMRSSCNLRSVRHHCPWPTNLDRPYLVRTSASVEQKIRNSGRRKRLDGAGMFNCQHTAMENS